MVFPTSYVEFISFISYTVSTRPPSGIQKKGELHYVQRRNCIGTYKASYVEHLKTKKTPHDFTDVKKEVTGLYNYIYENLKLEEPSK